MGVHLINMPLIIDVKALTTADSGYSRTSKLESDPWEDISYMKMAVDAARLVLRRCEERNLFLTLHCSTSATSRKIAVKVPSFSSEPHVNDRRFPKKSTEVTKTATSVVLLASSTSAKAASEIRKDVYERLYRNEDQTHADPSDDFNDIIIITRKHLDAMFNKHTGSFVRTFYYDKLTELRRTARIMCIMDTRLQKDPVEEKVMSMMMQMFITPPYVLDINNKSFTFKVVSGCLGHDMWLYPWREASLSPTEISSMNSHARTEYLHIRNFITVYETQKERTAAVDSDGNCYLLGSKKDLPTKFSVTMLHLNGGKIENCFVGSIREDSDIIVERIVLIGKILKLVCPDLKASVFAIGGVTAPHVPLSQEGLELLTSSTLELPKLEGRTHPIACVDNKRAKRSKVKL